MNEVFPITPFTVSGVNQYCVINEKIHLLFKLTNDNNYTVIVANQIVSKTDDKDYLIWNFEVQLAAITPRILD